MGGAAPGERTVAELAAELGISLKEATALCTVSGIAVRGPDHRLTEAQVQRVRDVLEGRAEMAPPKPPRRPIPGKLIVAALAVVGAVAVLTVVAGFLNRETSIIIRAGECFEDPGLFGNEIRAVACSDDAADYEAYAVLNLRDVYGETFPGRDELDARAQDRCRQLVPPPDGSGLVMVQFEYFYPVDAAAWSNGSARKIVCAQPV